MGLKEFNFVPKKNKRVWIHCASAGEYEQCVPLISALKKKFEIEIHISFFSASGMDYYSLNPICDYAFYLPYDTKNNAKKTLDFIQPDYILWVKYEFWKNFLSEIRRREIPCELIFADLRSIENKKFLESVWIKSNLNYFNHIYSISTPIHLKVKYELVTDGKWEKSLQNKHFPFEDEKVIAFSKKHTLIVVGSAHESDLIILKKLIGSSDFPNLKWLIVPHEIDDKHLQTIRQILPHTVLYSEKIEDEKILIYNQLGTLKYLYRYAQIAWIGGGFDKSIHNALEAAAYKIPIISGPHIKGQNEAEILKNNEVLFTFRNEDELKEIIHKLTAKSTSEISKRIENLYETYSKNSLNTIIESEIKDKLFSDY